MTEQQVVPLPGALPSPAAQAPAENAHRAKDDVDVEAAPQSGKSADMAIAVDALKAGDGQGTAETPKDVAAAEEESDPQYTKVTYFDIAKQFSIMGWIAFGGPAAHIGLFQKVREPSQAYLIEAALRLVEHIYISGTFCLVC